MSLIYAVAGYLVLWAMVDLYRTVLPSTLDASRIEAPAGRAIVLVTVTAVMFGSFATPGLLEDGLVLAFTDPGPRGGELATRDHPAGILSARHRPRRRAGRPARLTFHVMKETR